MSLVVLGIFSFRDLGVDLFPKADPATVNVSLRLPGASPDEMTSAVIMPMENALSGIAGIDQMRANDQRRRHGQHHRAGSCSSATWTTPPTPCAKRSPARCGTCRPKCCRRSFRKQDPDADPIMSLVLSGKTHEPAHADRDRRQADQARARVGRRRRRRQHQRRPAARDPRRRRRREAERARAVDRPGARRDSEGERRDSRRHARAGQVGGRTADARPHRRHRPVQRHHHRDRQRHAGPRSSDIGYAEDSVQKVSSVAVHAATAAPRSSSTSGAPPARTPSR